ncbi:unnamed protein product [Linum trigynum]|uniref:Uncharacterized protein n=1 Tax=Linum trigynum TaxID=586398 RepID=A0AAV2E0H9_9ROSI
MRGQYCSVNRRGDFALLLEIEGDVRILMRNFRGENVFWAIRGGGLPGLESSCPGSLPDGCCGIVFQQH